MKRRCTMIAFCVLVAGCDAASRSITGPAPGSNPPGPADSTTYTLAGRVHDADGVAVSGATLLLTGATSHQALSDERGEYRFTGVRGFFTLTVTADNYPIHQANVFVAADQNLIVTLRRLRILTLTPGVALRGTIDGAPCNPAWDDEAPCVVVDFTPAATGVYDVVLTWKGPSAVDLLIDGSLHSESYTGEIRAAVSGQAGVRREFHIHAYHLPYIHEEFELTASLRPGS